MCLGYMCSFQLYARVLTIVAVLRALSFFPRLFHRVRERAIRDVDGRNHRPCGRRVSASTTIPQHPPSPMRRQTSRLAPWCASQNANALSQVPADTPSDLSAVCRASAWIRIRWSSRARASRTRRAFLPQESCQLSAPETRAGQPRASRYHAIKLSRSRTSKLTRF
ncbi:hypothetical protein C8Q73DRAFT_482408 [Cubamyces lactineus]|nr:hypothetical protein C8Q73DRAFT_482408 [Cubamyces lactineus]